MVEQNKKLGFWAWAGIIFVGLLIVGSIGNLFDTEKSSAPKKPERLTEGGARYQQMVYERFKDVAADSPDIDSIKVDRSVLYINFIKPQTQGEYDLVAKMNAAFFSKFKKEKLGVSHVSVIVTYKGNVVAQANAKQ
ncbi:MAG: hypothetical protein HQ596_03355 [Candidatus Saganbacteria bacterium]|nr:hypothetical protein [Candidatus Saganbacteria bacterium]